MQTPVTVVTNAELGWDCVVGVYLGGEKDAKEGICADHELEEDELDGYFFHEQTLHQ